MQEKIVLASASPRRLELLRNAGFVPIVRPAHILERRESGEDAITYVRRLARMKTEAVACGPEETLLGADTVVEVENEILEKPASTVDAVRMLAKIENRWHQVHTGVCLRTADRLMVDVATTRVRFLPIPAEEVAEYVASGEPMDKAGAYAIQGIASRYVDRIEGCYFNVVGLPVSLVWRMLAAIRS